MKNKLKLKSLTVLGSSLAFATPFVLFAQNVVSDKCTEVGAQNLMYIICRAALLINTIIPILITLGVVYFIWGVISYVIGSSEEAKKEGRDRMIYGLIGILVIVSIWGLVAILKNTFGIFNAKTIQVPCIESPGISCPP